MCKMIKSRQSECLSIEAESSPKFPGDLLQTNEIKVIELQLN